MVVLAVFTMKFQGICLGLAPCMVDHDQIGSVPSFGLHLWTVARIPCYRIRGIGHLIILDDLDTDKRAACCFIFYVGFQVSATIAACDLE